MIRRICDVPECGKESPFELNNQNVPVLSEAVHDREMVDIPGFVIKQHDLCEDHYKRLRSSMLFYSITDIDGNYQGIRIPVITR